MNRSFSESTIDSMKNRALFLEKNRSTLVIDADTHASDCANLADGIRQRYEQGGDYYHGRPIDAQDLVRQMTMSGVDMALIWQNPAATPYTDDKNANFERLYAANRYIASSAAKYPDRFIPAGWTDPKNLGFDGAVKLAEICVFEFGFPIIKLNPAQNAFPIDSQVVIDMVEKIVSLGAVPAFHYGADTPYTPPEGLEKIAQLFPSSPIIGIHMGGGGAGYVEAEESYQKTRALGLRNANVHFIISAKRDTHIETDLIAFQKAGKPYCDNVSFGSDAPYGRMSWNFGGFRAMLKSLQDTTNHTDARIRNNEVTFTDSDVQKYLGGNFADLAAAAYRRLMSKYGIA